MVDYNKFAGRGVRDMASDTIVAPAKGATELPSMTDSVAAGVKEAPAAPLIGWGMLAVIYFCFSFLQDRNADLSETLKTGNIKANAHNILITTLGAIIGINLLKILFGKMSVSRVEMIRKIGELFLPVVANL